MLHPLDVLLWRWAPLQFLNPWYLGRCCLEFFRWLECVVISRNKSKRAYHAAVALQADWGFGPEWQAIGTRGKTGCVPIPLAMEVKKSPGLIDVYRVKPEHQEKFLRGLDEGKKYLLGQIGLPYGYRAVYRLCATMFPVARRIIPVNRDDDFEVKEPFCLSLAGSVLRHCGLDLKKKRADCFLLPEHFINSEILEYQFTLVP